MKIKVCGIVNGIQVRELDEMGVDMIGRIFYPDSPRCMAHKRPKGSKVPQIGVFVNADIGYILEQAERHRFHTVQLHGDESLSEIEALRLNGLEVIKAIALGSDFPKEQVERYAPVVDYLLLDTKGFAPGGNGISFDWKLLENYQVGTPFLLSGGIGPQHVSELRELRHDMLLGIDINSGFESEPGVKDLERIKTFIHDIRS